MKRFLNTKKLCILLLFSILLLLISCSERGNIRLLNKSEELLLQNADSALILLESIDFPEEMSEKYYAQYCELLVSAHIKNKIDIKHDTLIRHAVNYYNKFPDKKDNYIKSLLLLGKVYDEQENLELAEKFYFEVYLLSKQANNTYLIQESTFELGGLYMDLYQYKEAILWFDIARKIASGNEDRIKKNRSMRYTADCYVLLGRTDTALVIYNQVLSQLPLEKNAVQAEIYKNIAIAYKNAKKYNESLYFIQQSINVSEKESSYPLQYVILSSVYDKMGQRDSSNYYIQKALIHAKQQDNVDIIHKAYEFTLDSKFPDKFDNFLLINSFSSSTVLKLKHSTVKYKHLYKEEKIRKKNKQLIIERQRYLFLLSSIIIILITFFLYHRNIRKQKRIEFKNELKDKDTVIGLMRSSLYQRLELYIKMVKLSISPNKSKHKEFLSEYNKILFGKDGEFSLDWPILIDLTNNLFDNYFKKIECINLELIEPEIKIIMLLKLGFTVSDIALILEKSIHTIYRHSSNIRKKLNIPEEESVTEFFDRIIQNPL